MASRLVAQQSRNVTGADLVKGGGVPRSRDRWNREMEEVAKQPLIVVLPQQLAASHLKQCQRHLQESLNDALQLLYAAQYAHMALHTMLMEIRYGDTGVQVIKSRKNQPPRMLEEGVKLRGFRELINEIHIPDQQRADIALLTSVRDSLQHPCPGPMGYEVERLIFGVEAAVKIQRTMWDHPFVTTHSDDEARQESIVAGTAIIEICLQLLRNPPQKKRRDSCPEQEGRLPFFDARRS